MGIKHVTYQNEIDGFRTEYDLCIPEEIALAPHHADNILSEKNDEYEQRVRQFLQEYGETLDEIERLTNHADGLDYTLSVVSGIIAGAVDSLFVGDISLERAKEWGSEKVEDFVIKIAQMKGYKGNDLYGAVLYLENHFEIAADKATNAFGGGLQHHLRDFSHHPTLVGLFFSLFTQFTEKVYGTDVAGRFVIVPLSTDGLSLIGKNLPEKITFGVINWVFHMVSDMAGSSSSILEGKYGTGLPGPIVSLLKEVSALPLFKKMNEKGYNEFSVLISKLFNGTLLGKRDETGKLIPLQFDLRTEIGVARELGRQSIPVIINECIVRAFYFIRRLYIEIKVANIEKIEDILQLKWENTIPSNNRTIAKMVAISSGTLTTVDLADAAIRAVVAGGAFMPVFILRVNFVGVGRFSLAASADLAMGLKKDRMELAATSAEVAMSAVATVDTVDTISELHTKTQKRMKAVSSEIDKVSKLKF